MPVPRGGPATINGILIQLLWTLLNVTEITQLESDADPDALTASSAFIIAEPPGGGGDVVRVEAAGRRIQQIKARSDGGPWSLASLVGDVLPDLYTAVDLSRPDDVFEFITEGRRGDWGSVEAFFTTLKRRTQFDLDENVSLPFRHVAGGDAPVFDAPVSNEVSLFEWIAKRLRGADESEEEARRRTWHLLARLICRWEQPPQEWQAKIDRLLYELVDYAEDVAAKRDQLITALARLSASGNAHVRPAVLFDSCGLNAGRLSNWRSLTAKAATLLRQEAVLRGYIPEEDVRPTRPPSSHAPIVVFSGESGLGKTWRHLSLALHLAETNVVAYAEATQDFEADVQKAGDIFWQDIAGHDNRMSLKRVSARLRGVERVPSGRWLYYFLDGVQTAEGARRLATIDWEGQGVCLVATAPPLAAEAFRQHSRGRAEVLPVEEFTEAELRRYLAGSDHASWHAIPADVRDTLRRPLLARLYKLTVPGGGYTPPSEYALYDRWWAGVREGREVTAGLLVSLAGAVLDGDAYPWTAGQLSEAGLTQSQADDLLRQGAIQRTGDGRFAVWHDRLLNWLAAESQVEASLAGVLDAVDLCARLRGLFTSNTMADAGEGRRLGYVPMDVLWMLAVRGAGEDHAIDSILDALGDGDWHTRRVLFRGLLPTVGPGIVAPLTRYIGRHAADAAVTGINDVVEGMLQLPAVSLAPAARELLGRGDLTGYSIAARLLVAAPDPTLLDPLWRLNCDLYGDPNRFDRPGSSWATTAVLRDRCFRALLACARLDPGWLDAAVGRADPASEPVHDLAYLLAGLHGDRDRWLRCKPTLMDKVRPDKVRAIADNIYTHRDAAEIAWLRTRVAVSEDGLGPHCLRALALMEPAVAAELLPQLGGQELYWTRGWCLRALLLRLPAETCAQLLRRLPREPENTIQSFFGQVNALSPDIVDWLLDRAEVLLRDAGKLEDAALPLGVLARVHRLDLLERLERRRGTALEERLAALLATGPRPYLSQETPAREPALAVLTRIGGGGIIRVINAWLAAPSRYGRYDAFGEAFKSPDAETLRILEGIAVGGADVEENGHQAYLATEALARIGAWRSVVRSVVTHGVSGTPRSVGDACVGRVCLVDSVMGEALAAFREHGGRHAGALLALGVGGRSDYLEHILGVLGTEPPASEVARACVLALSLLDDPEGLATDALARQLPFGEMQFAAVNALLRNPNPRALAALVGHAQSRGGNELAAILTRFDAARGPATEILRRSLKDSASGWDSPWHHLEARSDPEVILSVLNDPEAREKAIAGAFAVEGGVWHVGSKSETIALLAVTDRETAFGASLLALQNEDGHDREHYPYLMVEIDSARAVPVLFDLVIGGLPLTVRAAVGRALHDVAAQTLPSLLEWLTDERPERRVAACRIAAHQEPTQGLCDAVSLRLDDERTDVAEAAEEALWSLRRSAWCRDLMATYAGEQDAARGWRLLEAAIEVGDPGDDFRPCPDWMAPGVANLPTCQWEYVSEKLKGRRDKVRKNLEDAQRDTDW